MLYPQTDAKRSVYVFLTSLLGVMLFLMIHRLLVFFTIIFSFENGRILGLNYFEFVALDYFTLLFTMILGIWYGIWLGEYWYEKVYVEKIHGGLLSLLVGKFWQPKKHAQLKQGIFQMTKKLEHDLWDMEDLAKTIPDPIKSPKAIKRRVVRKKVQLPKILV